MGKVVKKKVSKKVSKKKVVKRLTASELLTIRVDDEKRKYADLFLKYTKLEREYHALELKLIEKEYKMKTYELQRSGDVVLESTNKVESLIGSRNDFVSELQSRHNLSEKWGFNPKTGLIKEG